MTISSRRRFALGRAAPLALSALALLGCRSASRRDLDAAAAPVVRAELERYYGHLSDRDWPKFSDHFWSGATITTIWQPPGESTPRVVAASVGEFVEQAPKGPGSKPIFEERMLEGEVRVYHDLAQAWVRYRARFGEPGAVQEWEGIDSFSLFFHEGRWRISSIAFAGDEIPPK